jgi:hypothetical protein
LAGLRERAVRIAAGAPSLGGFATVELLDAMETLASHAAIEFHGEPPSDGDFSTEGSAEFDDWWERYPGW